MLCTTLLGNPFEGGTSRSSSVLLFFVGSKKIQNAVGHDEQNVREAGCGFKDLPS
jgi:hypothetical protein